jgi:hypothetical protein
MKVDQSSGSSAAIILAMGTDPPLATIVLSDRKLVGCIPQPLPPGVEHAPSASASRTAKILILPPSAENRLQPVPFELVFAYSIVLVEPEM